VLQFCPACDNMWEAWLEVTTYDWHDEEWSVYNTTPYYAMTEIVVEL